MAEPTQPDDVMRGVAGAVIIGLPLVYTQEIWLEGRALPPLGILALLAVSFSMNLILSKIVGFNSGRIQRPFEDAVVGFGLSFLLAGGMLWVLDRIGLQMPLVNAIGVVAIAAVPASLGFALGNALAPVEGGKGSEKLESGWGDILAAAAGAVVLSLNIAPTEEPVLLADELTWPRLVTLVLLSLALSYLMVFYADFGGKHERAGHGGAHQTPLAETLIAYLTAFAMSAGLLAAFGQLDGLNETSLARVTVLSFPASMGAALGRMLV